MTSKKKIISLLIKFISFLIIIFLLYLYLKDKFSFSFFISSITNLSWIELGIILFITNAIIILRAYNWKIILNTTKNNVKLKFAKYLSPIYASQALNIVIPGKGGELIRFFYVRDYFKTGFCVGSILFERIIDLLCLLIFSVSGIFIIKNIYTTIFSLAGLIGLILILIIFFKKKVFNKFKNLIFKKVKSKKIQNVFNDFGDFYQEIGAKKKKLILFVLFSIVGWVISIIQCFLMLKFLGINLSFLSVLSRIPIGILITLIPVSFGGLGTREAAFLFLFDTLITPEKIITFSLLFYFSRILFQGLIGIIPLVNIKSKKKNTLIKNENLN